jgi:enterochelin esterase-like enzyme
MYRFLFAAMLLLVLPWEVFAGGTVVNTSFFSPAMGQEKSVQVYLPEGYQPQGSGRYPVVYYFHGAGPLLGHNEFPTLVATLDEMIAAHQIKPVILVRPDGFSSPYPASFYTSSVLYGDLEGYMSTDLIAWMDANYRTIPSRMKRALMGHSMGGYGALMYYGQHPDLYCCAAGVCASGLDLPSMLAINVYGVLAELQAMGQQGPPWVYTPSAGFANAVLFSMSGAFSPNLANPPFYVDLPLDPYANVVPEVWELWMQHNMPSLVQDLAYPPWRHDGRIYFDAGTQDQFYIMPSSNAFACSLDVMGIDYEYQVFEGGHFDKLDERFPVALDFICSAMHHNYGGRDVGANPESVRIIDDHLGYADASGEIVVAFHMSAPGDVSLAVYDCAGRRVSLLHEGEMEPGGHTLRVSTRGLPSGMYLYGLTCGGDFTSGKVLLVR